MIGIDVRAIAIGEHRDQLRLQVERHVGNAKKALVANDRGSARTHLKRKKISAAALCRLETQLETLELVVDEIVNSTMTKTTVQAMELARDALTRAQVSDEDLDVLEATRDAMAEARSRNDEANDVITGMGDDAFGIVDEDEIDAELRRLAEEEVSAAAAALPTYEEMAATKQAQATARVKPDGARPLTIAGGDVLASPTTLKLDSDLAATAAALRSLEAEGRELPDTRDFPSFQEMVAALDAVSPAGNERPSDGPAEAVSMQGSTSSDKKLGTKPLKAKTRAVAM